MTEMQLTVNGTDYTIDSHEYRPLRDVLREEVGLTGTKESCETGTCGVCSVLVDEAPTKSCLIPVCKAVDHQITTVEGIGNDGEMDQIQQSFVDCFASQCGYCIPGFIVSAHAFLESNPDPTIPEIEEGLSGNICRCTGYRKIVEAVADAAENME